MSTRKRKILFDPSAVKDKVFRRKDSTHDVISRAREFLQAVRCLSPEDMEYVCSQCDDIAAQLVITAKVGIVGCEAVKFAYNHIPESFLSERATRVHEIVLEASGKPSPEDSCLCGTIAMILENRFPRYWNRKPAHSAYLPELKRLTECRGISYFHFISPPVHKCLNSACGQCGAASLAPHHPPINAVVFTTNGPVAATKVSLRCKSCSMVYNNNMYGNKRGEGEMLYSSWSAMFMSYSAHSGKEQTCCRT